MSNFYCTSCLCLLSMHVNIVIMKNVIYECNARENSLLCILIIYLSICLSIYLSFPSIHVSIYLFIFLFSIRLYICQPVNIFILSIHPFRYLSFFWLIGINMHVLCRIGSYNKIIHLSKVTIFRIYVLLLLEITVRDRLWIMHIGRFRFFTGT